MGSYLAHNKDGSWKFSSITSAEEFLFNSRNGDWKCQGYTSSKQPKPCAHPIGRTRKKVIWEHLPKLITLPVLCEEMENTLESLSKQAVCPRQHGNYELQWKEVKERWRNDIRNELEVQASALADQQSYGNTSRDRDGHPRHLDEGTSEVRTKSLGDTSSSSAIFDRPMTVELPIRAASRFHYDGHMNGSGGSKGTLGGSSQDHLRAETPRNTSSRESEPDNIFELPSRPSIRRNMATLDIPTQHSLDFRMKEGNIRTAASTPVSVASTRTDVTASLTAASDVSIDLTTPGTEYSDSTGKDIEEVLSDYSPSPSLCRSRNVITSNSKSTQSVALGNFSFEDEDIEQEFLPRPKKDNSAPLSRLLWPRREHQPCKLDDFAPKLPTRVQTLSIPRTTTDEHNEVSTGRRHSFHSLTLLRGYGNVGLKEGHMRRRNSFTLRQSPVRDYFHHTAEDEDSIIKNEDVICVPDMAELSPTTSIEATSVIPVPCIVTKPPLRQMLDRMRHYFPSERPIRGGYVYCYQRADIPDLIKIGFTVSERWPNDSCLQTPPSVQKRINDWSTCDRAHDVELLFIQWMHCAVGNMERLIHAHLSKNRVHIPCKTHKKRHVEWFQVTVSEAKKIAGFWSRFSSQSPYDKRIWGLNNLWMERTKDCLEKLNHDKRLKVITQPQEELNAWLNKMEIWLSEDKNVSSLAKI